MPAKKKTVRKTAKKAAKHASAILVPEKIEPLVLYLRREKVILDADLAELYGVETKRINEAVKRNLERFPEDFMFQLSEDEWDVLRPQNATLKKEGDSLRSQTATSSASPSLLFQSGTSKTRGGRRTRPYAFTEQGVAMLSSVLRSPRAVEVNIAIMRTFVQLRRLMDSNKLLAEKIEKLEKKYDENFSIVFDAIRQLIAADSKPKREVGFHAK